MILYLDTSAFLKLYLDEPDSHRVREAIAGSSAASTHLLTYAEMRAGFAQAVRMKRLSESERTRHLERFEADWRVLAVIAVDEPLVRRAGEFAERFDLRGFDSVHLAAAERVFDSGGRSGSFRFVAFDSDLRAGAAALGMNVLA